MINKNGKNYIYSIQIVRVYILYTIYKEIYYAALWQCLMMERKQKMQNNMEKARKNVCECVLGVLGVRV